MKKLNLPAAGGNFFAFRLACRKALQPAGRNSHKFLSFLV